MNRVAVMLSLIFQLTWASDPTRISGDLKGAILSANGPYIVTGDIRVPPGEVVIIGEGTVFLFQNFSGLNVQGTLLALGSQTMPVVFTSENDTAYNMPANSTAAPYDWNGITVGDGASGSTFKNCLVRYSLYGINSVTGFISVSNCTFYQNGKADLRVAGKRIVPFNGAITYNISSPSEPPPVFQRNTTCCRKAALRTAGISFLIGGLSAGIWENLQFQRANQRLQRIDNSENYSFQRWKDARYDRNLNLSGTVLGYTAAFLGAAGIYFSFKF